METKSQYIRFESSISFFILLMDKLDIFVEEFISIGSRNYIGDSLKFKCYYGIVLDAVA